MDDINSPATLNEIAMVLGKSKSTVSRMAKKWRYSEIPAPGKAKRLYDLKDLPREVYEAVFAYRFDKTINPVNVIEGCEENGVYPVDRGSVETDTAQPVSGPVSSGQLARTDSTGELAHVSEKQRISHLAIGSLIRFIDDFESSESAAIRYLNQGYREQTLSSNLVWALENAAHKSSGVNKTGNVLSRDSVQKWRKRYQQQGNYIPGVRQKDMAIKPWQVDLIAMITNNPQKKPVVWMHEQLAKKYGDGVSKYMVWRFVRERFSRKDLIKGQNSGMQLRAKQAYQPRTSAGLEPWMEIHADGWTTHFTAPHPITGEFVTYEVWDFHDVATRYVPRFGVGMSENYEVIAKGVEFCIRDGGVMLILQVDSTRIVKNNDKFTGDPVKSIADKAGFTIVHPKTVGNAQANGIPENFHTWLDKEARELATYQAKNMDSLTLRRTKKITAKMAKAAQRGELELREQLKAEAEKTGKGFVLDSYEEVILWLESKRQKWNNKPHRSLKKIRDEQTGKMRHQTPQEALDEFKANGWEPVLMDEAILQDLFLVHKPMTVKRGMVSPYGEMLFRHPELDHWEGQKVYVAYDSMNSDQVWVKDLRGELICIAPFLEATGYRSVTAYEAAQEKRAVAQIKNRERQIKAIKARAGIEEYNVIDVQPSDGLKRIETDTVQTIDAPLNPVRVEPEKEEEKTEPKGYLELWGMLLSEDEEEEPQHPKKDGSAGQ